MGGILVGSIGIAGANRKKRERRKKNMVVNYEFFSASGIKCIPDD